MKQRLFSRFFLLTTAIVLLCLTVMMMLLTIMYNRYLADSEYTTLQNTCSQITALIESSNNADDAVDGSEKEIGGVDTELIYYNIKSISNVLDMDIFVTDKDGVIDICSCDSWIETGNCEHTGSKLSLETDDIDKRKIDTLGIYEAPHYYVFSKLDGENLPYQYVVTVSPVSGVNTLMKRVARVYFFAAVIPVILMFFALYFVTYRMSRPLKLMSNAAKAMARGDFSKRIPVTSDDEIGELAVSFNQMTNSLARLEETRKSFIANVSHELKTPMTTIGGFIDGIIDGTIPYEKQSYYLGIVSDEIKRLSRMVEAMLNVSKLESGEFSLKKEKFDFRELLFSIVISQEQRIEAKNLDIRGLDAVPSITVYADKDLIHRVVYNLVDNAVKFNVDGGYIDFSLKADSRKMLFSITNSGKGIPQGDLPYVFERFYKVDKSRSANKNSTGLGLYIVKTIVKNHGGTITVFGKENEFTRFEVVLPLLK